MKTTATTLTIGIGMALGLIAPAAQAAVVWGDAATASTLTLKANTNHHLLQTPTHPANYFQVLRNTTDFS